MSRSVCPSCGTAAEGRFCSECGAALAGPAACRECGNALPPAARFCNACGMAVGAAPNATPVGAVKPAASAPPLPWLVAGLAVLALLFVVLLPRFRDEAPPQAGFTPPPGAAAPVGPAAIDLASMTPREAADRLFDRVMRMASAGDSAGARGFVPMALDAYARVDELDLDARYHLAVLNLFVGEHAAADEEARAILREDEGHLFGLFTAAQAARQRGDDAEAQRLFSRFLELYPTEIVRDLPEYTAHAAAFPEMRAEAQAFVGAAAP